jgi:hypothetical protein
MISSRTNIEQQTVLSSQSDVDQKGAAENNTMDILKMYMRSNKKDKEEE